MILETRVGTNGIAVSNLDGAPDAISSIEWTNDVNNILVISLSVIFNVNFLSLDFHWFLFTKANAGFIRSFYYSDMIPFMHIHGRIVRKLFVFANICSLFKFIIHVNAVSLRWCFFFLAELYV